MAEWLRIRWYLAWLAVFVLAAVDVSFDPIDMLYEALPMIALYEAYSNFTAWLEA